MSGDHNRYASVNVNDHDTPESMLAAIRAARSELQQKQATCQHRWEQTLKGWRGLAEDPQGGKA